MAKNSSARSKTAASRRSRSARDARPAEEVESTAHPDLPLRDPFVTCVAAWLVPGLGHLLLGRRARALAFAALVLGSLAFGVAIDGKMPLSFQGAPLQVLATLGALGSGAVYLVLRVLLGHEGDPAGWGYDYGWAFILSAGLMNLLLVLDAWDICWGKELVDREQVDARSSEAADAADDETTKNGAEEDDT